MSEASLLVCLSKSYCRKPLSSQNFRMLRIRGSYFQGIMLANESLFSNLFAIHMLQQKNHVISDLFFLCALSFGCKRACPWYFFFILLSLFFVFLVSYLLIICYNEKIMPFQICFLCALSFGCKRACPWYFFSSCSACFLCFLFLIY